MSSGYLYGESEPIEPCPYCDKPCRADFVDVGVGMTQCGPYHCEHCGASEIGPYDKERGLTEAEKKTGWYGPDSEPGSSANVIGGRVVSHHQMDHAYRERFYKNPEYDEPGVVTQWQKDIRENR